MIALSCQILSFYIAPALQA